MTLLSRWKRGLQTGLTLALLFGLNLLLGASALDDQPRPLYGVQVPRVPDVSGPTVPEPEPTPDEPLAPETPEAPEDTPDATGEAPDA